MTWKSVGCKDFINCYVRLFLRAHQSKNKNMSQGGHPSTPPSITDAPQAPTASELPKPKPVDHPQWALKQKYDDEHSWEDGHSFKMYGDTCIDMGQLTKWRQAYAWPCCGTIGTDNRSCTAPSAPAPVDTKNMWRADAALVAKWEAIDPDPRTCNGRCTIVSTAFPNFTACGRLNVMATTIPAGCRAGARPCGSLWQSRDRVYCHKCKVRHLLEQGTSPASIPELN